MKLNKKLELAISAVSALKNKSGFSKTSDLATEIGTSKFFLDQIMRNLRMAGLVEVKRGPGGGYQLVPGQVVTAYHVAEAIGRNFGTLSFSMDPNSRLQRSILAAFAQTEI